MARKCVGGSNASVRTLRVTRARGRVSYREGAAVTSAAARASRPPGCAAGTPGLPGEGWPYPRLRRAANSVRSCAELCATAARRPTDCAAADDRTPRRSGSGPAETAGAGRAGASTVLPTLRDTRKTRLRGIARCREGKAARAPGSPSLLRFVPCQCEPQSLFKGKSRRMTEIGDRGRDIGLRIVHVAGARRAVIRRNCHALDLLHQAPRLV